MSDPRAIRTEVNDDSKSQAHDSFESMRREDLASRHELTEGHYAPANERAGGRAALPVAAQAVGGTITYSVNGRQYIAMTAGGGPIAALSVGMTPEADTTSGSNAVYVFALPQ